MSRVDASCRNLTLVSFILCLMNFNESLENKIYIKTQEESHILKRKISIWKQDTIALQCQ